MTTVTEDTTCTAWSLQWPSLPRVQVTHPMFDQGLEPKLKPLSLSLCRELELSLVSDPAKRQGLGLWRSMISSTHTYTHTHSVFSPHFPFSHRHTHTHTVHKQAQVNFLHVAGSPSATAERPFRWKRSRDEVVLLPRLQHLEVETQHLESLGAPPSTFKSVCTGVCLCWSLCCSGSTVGGDPELCLFKFFPPALLLSHV